MSAPPQSSNSTPLNVLIIGAGCAGPVLAQVLTKANPKHKVTVVERYHTLRTGGQQLDLKAEGVRIAKGLGILDALKEACVHETGMRFVDSKGKALMRLGINDPSHQGNNLTNEYEIMRGDMVQVFYDGSIAERKRVDDQGENEGSLTYKFDTTVTELENSDEGVAVTFSTGQKEYYDLVVGADGQGSRTRRTTFGPDIEAKAFQSIGVHAAYYEIPREFDDNDARIYFGTDSRMVMTRSGDRSKTQIYLFVMNNKERHDKMRVVQKQPLEQVKKAWTEMYDDAGWDCRRFLEGLKTTNDFYTTELAQVHMPKLYSGRVVLLGDAGYCPTPFTGMGTTLSLVGSYILAGELARHGDDIGTALQAYHDNMRQPLDLYQRLPGGGTKFYPSSRLGIKIANIFVWILSSLQLHRLAQWALGMIGSKKNEWEMPVYPELNMDVDREVFEDKKKQ
jgi:2-polyprenyl-6-methoxyphenol hydroxylase-like FAD-dependent oxidoreductase